jgi:hypothetical protein
MAQPFSTGAVDVFCNPGAVATPVYLGTGRMPAKPRFQRFFRPVHTDHGGDVPIDECFAGEMAHVQVVLSRWNEGVLAFLEDVARAGTASPLRGTYAPGSHGTLLIEEAQAYRLWLRFPYRAKAQFSRAGNVMRAGYRFMAAFLNENEEVDPGFPGSMQISLGWRCLRTFDVSVTNAFGQGQYVLFDEDMTGLPPIN